MNDTERQQLESRLAELRGMGPCTEDSPVGKEITEINAKLSASASLRPQPTNPEDPRQQRTPQTPPWLAFVLALILPLALVWLALVFVGRLPLSRGGAGFDEWTGGE